MSAVVDRIVQAPACTVIDLSESEKDIYRGAGWKLAEFVDGNLVGFFDPMEVSLAEDALRNAIAWMAIARGEVWLVMCSCYQLCEPRRIAADDASAIAYMARVFGEQMGKF